MTHTPGPESQVAWAPDSTRIVYLSQRDAVNHVFLYDFTKHAETQLTRDALPDQGPRFSPDGKSIAFVRDRKELRVVDPGNQAGARAGVRVSSAADSGRRRIRLVARQQVDRLRRAPKAARLRNVYVVPAAGGTPRQISFLANSNVNSIRVEPGRKVPAVRNQPAHRNPAGGAHRPGAAASPSSPKSGSKTCSSRRRRAPAAAGAAAAEAKPPVKPVEIEFEDIRERITMLPIGLTASNPRISPDGKLLLFSATVGGQTNLYLYPLDETPEARARRGGRGGRGGGERGRAPVDLHAGRQESRPVLARFAGGLLPGRRPRRRPSPWIPAWPAR